MRHEALENKNPARRKGAKKKINLVINKHKRRKGKMKEIEYGIWFKKERKRITCIYDSR